MADSRPKTGATIENIVFVDMLCSFSGRKLPWFGVKS
jgi:hypothetical protein